MSKRNFHPAEWFPIAAVFLVVGFGFCLRFPDLDRESLWGDEINLTQAAIQSNLSETIQLVQKPHSVGYPVFLHYWMLGGKGEAFIRLPSLLTGTLTLLLLYFLLARVSNPRVALMGSFMLAVIPAHIRFSREVAAYAPQTAVLLGGVLCWLNILEKNRFRDWTGFTLLAVLSHYLHPLASTTNIGLFFLIPFVCSTGVRSRSFPLNLEKRKPPWVLWIFSGTAFLVLSYSQIQRNIEGAEKNFATAPVPPSLHEYLGELTTLLGGQVWVFPLIIIGLLYIFRESPALGIVFTGWGAGTTAIWLAFVRSQAAHFDYHYFISHLPAFASLAALGVEFFLWIAGIAAEKTGLRCTWWRNPAAGLIMLGFAVAYWPGIREEQNRKWPNYRAAGQFLTYRLEKQDRFYIKPDWWLPSKIRYYCPQVLDREVGVEVFFREDLQQQIDREGGTLYVVTRRPFEPRTGYRRQLFHGVVINWKDPNSGRVTDYREMYQRMRSTRAGKGVRPLDLLHDAKDLRDAGNLEAACELIIQAASAAPYHQRILRRKAEILAQAGRAEEAIAAFDAAYRRVPPDQKWWMLVGKAENLCAIGKHEEALQTLKRAFDEPNCNRAYLWEGIGKELYELRRYNKAREALLKAIEVWRADRPGALKYLGEIAAAEGKNEQAVSFLKRALAAGPEESDRQEIEKRLKELQPGNQPPTSPGNSSGS